MSDDSKIEPTASELRLRSLRLQGLRLQGLRLLMALHGRGPSRR